MISWETDGGPLPDNGVIVTATESSSDSLVTSNSTMTHSRSYNSVAAVGNTQVNQSSIVTVSSSISHTEYYKEVLSGTGVSSSTARTFESGMSHSASASNSVRVLDYEGGTTVGSSTFSSTESSSSLFRQSIRVTTTAGGGFTTLTTSSSTSGSTSTTSSATESLTESFAPYAGNGQTTTQITVARSFTSYSTASSSGSINTTTTVASGTSLTTSTSSYAGHYTYSTTAAISSTVTTTNASPTSPYHASNTNIIADRCKDLYTGAGLGGVAAFCGHFVHEPGTVVYTPLYQTYQDTYTVPGGGQTDYYFSATQLTESDSPVLYGTYSVQVSVKRPVVGYQHQSMLGVSDGVYSSYTINVPLTVTNTAELTWRRAGQTYARLNVTQVLTRHTDDTLVMQTLLTSSTVSQLVGTKGGGYGGAGSFSNTWKLWKGSWNYTTYNSATSGTGTLLVTATASTSEFPAGVVYGFERVNAYGGTAGWDTPQKIKIVELECLI